MFAVIACAMALSGCSSEDNCTTVNPQPEENATEIKLNAGILGVATRAPVSTNDNITASFVASTTDGDYTTNAWNSTVTFVASPTPTSALSFSPARYYPVNSSTIYIKGYYPAGTRPGFRNESDCLPLVVHLQPPADAIAVQVRIRHGISRIGRQRDQPRNQTTEGTCHVGPEYSRHDVHYQRSYAFGNLSHHNGRGNGKQLSDGEKR